MSRGPGRRLSHIKANSNRIGSCGEFSRTTLAVSRAYISKSLLDNPGATFCGARVRITPFILPLNDSLTYTPQDGQCSLGLESKSYARIVVKTTQLVVY